MRSCGGERADEKCLPGFDREGIGRSHFLAGRESRSKRGTRQYFIILSKCHPSLEVARLPVSSRLAIWLKQGGGRSSRPKSQWASDSVAPSVGKGEERSSWARGLTAGAAFDPAR